MTFTVRPATPEDHPVFARLFVELGVHDPTPTRDEFATTMLPRVLVVDEGDETLGYIDWQVYGPTAHVTHLVTDPRVRGRGAGRALIEAVRALVLAEGCERWYLHVKRDNAAAIHLYEARGFRAQIEMCSLHLTWTQIANLPRPVLTLPVFTPTVADDAAISARFDIDVERLARFRSWPRRVFVGLREGEAIVAYTAFDPKNGTAHSFRYARPEIAGLLLDALRAHASPEGPETLQFSIENDRPLVDALLASGATIVHEILRMTAELR
jgi:GNAT superfamily N-acetyltransferase